MCLSDDYFGVFGGFVDIGVTSLVIAPGADGVLRAEVELSVSVNSSGEPMLVEYDAFCFEGACDAWIEPFPLFASAEVVFVEVAD